MKQMREQNKALNSTEQRPMISSIQRHKIKPKEPKRDKDSTMRMQRGKRRTTKGSDKTSQDFSRESTITNPESEANGGETREGPLIWRVRRLGSFGDPALQARRDNSVPDSPTRTRKRVPRRPISSQVRQNNKQGSGDQSAHRRATRSSKSPARKVWF